MGCFDKQFYALPLSHDRVRDEWRRECFSFGVFRDLPGQEWNGFVHSTDEYVVVAEGELQISVGAVTAAFEPGNRVRIPRDVVHPLKTVSPQGSLWLYGCGDWPQSGAGGGDG